jgi:hypothetical protein
MKKLTLLFSYVFIVFTGFSQSKKEQIELLNLRIDSLRRVLNINHLSYQDTLSLVRNGNKNLTSEIHGLTTKMNELNHTIDALHDQKRGLSDTNDKLKHELEELSKKQQSSQLVDTRMTFKSEIYNPFIEFAKTKLFKHKEFIAKTDMLKPYSQLHECRLWSKGNDVYSLVIIKEFSRITEDVSNEFLPEISLCYYILKYTNNKILIDFSWSEIVTSCPVDSDNNNIDFQLTDLNADGNLEVWCVNENYCKGGMDPNNLNVYLYENQKIHLMKSVTNMPSMEITDKEIREWISDGVSMYSINQFDSNFQKLPIQYRDFAEQLRKRNILGSDGFNFYVD